MTKKKGFFQRLKEAVQEAQEDTIRDMRGWGREIGQAKEEGRKPDYARNIYFTQDEILKRWHVDIVIRLRRKVNKMHNNEEADYLIQEALRCLKNKDTHNAMVYLQGAYEKVGDPKIQTGIKKIQKGPSLATKIMMKGLKEKGPPDIQMGMEEAELPHEYDELPPETGAMLEEVEEPETRLLEEYHGPETSERG